MDIPRGRIVRGVDRGDAAQRRRARRAKRVSAEYPRLRGISTSPAAAVPRRVSSGHLVGKTCSADGPRGTFQGHGISTCQPRRRRDPLPRNIHLASPRLLHSIPRGAPPLPTSYASAAPTTTGASAPPAASSAVKSRRAAPTEAPGAKTAEQPSIWVLARCKMAIASVADGCGASIQMRAAACARSSGMNRIADGPVVVGAADANDVGSGRAPRGADSPRGGSRHRRGCHVDIPPGGTTSLATRRGQVLKTQKDSRARGARLGAEIAFASAAHEDFLSGRAARVRWAAGRALLGLSSGLGHSAPHDTQPCANARARASGGQSARVFEAVTAPRSSGGAWTRERNAARRRGRPAATSAPRRRAPRRRALASCSNLSP